MTRRPRARAVGAVVVTAGSALLFAACSSPSPSATGTTSSTTSRPTTPVPAVAPCLPSSVSASVDFTQFAHANTAPAGAIVFRDTGTAPCVLRGVPQVQVASSTGQTVAAYQAPGPAAVDSAVVTPAPPSGTGSDAAASVTFSAWGCPLGSFSLVVRFPGWAGPVTAGTRSAGGSCTSAQGSNQTIYIGPVTAVPG